jgi:hypothetical protein
VIYELVKQLSLIIVADICMLILGKTFDQIKHKLRTVMLSKLINLSSS